jgi:hypothetical protein
MALFGAPAVRGNFARFPGTIGEHVIANLLTIFNALDRFLKRSFLNG